MHIFKIVLYGKERGDIEAVVAADNLSDAFGQFSAAADEHVGDYAGTVSNAECIGEVSERSEVMRSPQVLVMDLSDWRGTEKKEEAEPAPEDELAAARERAKAEDTRPLMIRSVEKVVNSSRTAITPSKVRDELARGKTTFAWNGLTIKDVSSCLSDLVKQGKIARPAKGKYGKLKK